jgi:hypothetical protein
MELRDDPEAEELALIYRARAWIPPRPSGRRGDHEGQQRRSGHHGA